MMDIKCSERELHLLGKMADVAQNLGMPAYLIGGFVRDKILNRATKDLDIVCIGDGIALAQAVAANLEPMPMVAFFKNFGTAQIRLGDGLEIEFVGARKESYNSDSRKPEVFKGSLEDDQNRRDFTINALAISLNKASYGKLIDPFGGVAHLQQKLLKTPLDPDLTFSDDPLRMMRAIRFATQLGFTIEEETFKAITRNAARLSIISQERITDELNKIILTDKPSVGFDLLFRSGLLQQFFPMMCDLAGTTIVEGKGHKDNFYHTLQVLDNIVDRGAGLWLRWAAILHDIGKPATKRFEEGHGWTFHGHDAVGERMTAKIFKRLKLPLGENMKYVAKLVALHLRPISLSKEDITDSAMRRLLFDAGADLEDLMLLCESDITSKNPNKVKRYTENFRLVKQRLAVVEENDKMRAWQPPVDGAEIMQIFGLPPSKEVGYLKAIIRESILDNIIPNTREAAMHLLLEKAAEKGLYPV